MGLVVQKGISVVLLYTKKYSQIILTKNIWLSGQLNAFFVHRLECGLVYIFRVLLQNKAIKLL